MDSKALFLIAGAAAAEARNLISALAASGCLAAAAMLGQVSHGDNQESPGPIDHPGIVRLAVGNLRGNSQAALLDFSSASPESFEDGGNVQRAVSLPLCKGQRIPAIQDVDPFVVGEKSHARVKPCR
jgi:hypothetical protein